ncbi:MAG: hypothetical protein HY578_08835 [Nitrospinae bacterium]|nr:hypothetical protein [Nitrospinota bacterium]
MKFRNEDLIRESSSPYRYILKDPWGNAYIYVSRTYYRTADADSEEATPKGPFHPTTTSTKRRSYNIYSLGPDSRTYSEVRYSDAGGSDWDLSTMYDNIQDGDSDNTQVDTDTYNDDDINNW